MPSKLKTPVGILWTLLTLGLPVLLFQSALRTFRALDEQRVVYLRSRAAAVAARLETLSTLLTADQMVERFDDEPGLVDLEIIGTQSGGEKDPLAALWEGRELFRTESVRVEGEPVFRAWVPFHDRDGLHLARIDIAESASSFLVGHARHHLWFVALGGLVIIGLSLFTAWSVQRTAEAGQRQLELEHLAQLGQMSAVLAHEIRNPLGTIKGFVQLAGERHPERDSDLIEPILAQISRLERLVRDLLLYGRSAQPSFREVSSRALAETLYAHAARISDSGAARLETAVADVTFATDPNLLEQALLNLVHNAMDAVRGQPGGVVRLEAEALPAGTRWRVLDNGPGFSPDARRRMFEPFYTSKASGTGLGLSITWKLVDTLGGKLTIRNRPEGGTAAEIQLPGRNPATAV